MAESKEKRVSRTAPVNRTPARPKRIPVSGGARSILEVEGLSPEYHHRWVNDDNKGRIERFVAAHYEFVKADGVSGERSIDNAKSPDSVMTKKVGGNVVAYLMRIKQELFLEDKASKAADVSAREESLFRELNKQGDVSYGNVTFDRK